MADSIAPAPAPKELVVRTEQRVAELLRDGGLVLPERYAWQNALKSAWLVLQDATIQGGPHKDKRVLDVCSERSVANALLDMVVQGLNVGAKQGYFIPYGQTLTFQRSYFGSIAVAKRVAGVEDVRALPIYQEDAVELEVEDGRRRVVSHRQTFASIREGTLVGAYAIVDFRDADRPPLVEVMTIEEIRASWGQSRGYRYDPKKSTHATFPEAMALRTVIQRALKPLINAATDDYLFLDSYNREPEAALEEELDAELEEANTIDVDVALEAPAEEPLEAAEELEIEELDVEELEAEPAPAPRRGRKEPEAAAEVFPEDPGF